MDAQLLGNAGHALPVRRAHPPSHVSLNRLAVPTYCSAPSSPLVKIERGGETSTFLPEGVSRCPVLTRPWVV
jgi:hypothetical protein